MKKSIQHFIMLVLCTGIISIQSFAQDVGGGEADGLIPDPSGAIGFIAAPDFQPPSFILTLKRNNGNGHCTGAALATLNIKGTWSGRMWLTEIASQRTGIPTRGQALLNDGLGNLNKGNLLFCLNYNIPPKNRLIFKFRYETVGGATGEFWIPEIGRIEDLL